MIDSPLIQFKQLTVKIHSLAIVCIKTGYCMVLLVTISHFTTVQIGCILFLPLFDTDQFFNSMLFLLHQVYFHNDLRRNGQLQAALVTKKTPVMKEHVLLLSSQDALPLKQQMACKSEQLYSVVQGDILSSSLSIRWSLHTILKCHTCHFYYFVLSLRMTNALVLCDLV